MTLRFSHTVAKEKTVVATQKIQNENFFLANNNNNNNPYYIARVATNTIGKINVANGEGNNWVVGEIYDPSNFKSSLLSNLKTQKNQNHFEVF